MAGNSKARFVVGSENRDVEQMSEAKLSSIETTRTLGNLVNIDFQHIEATFPLGRGP